MDLQISRIILFVKNVPAVATFYRDVLGLKVVGEIDPGWTELSAGGCNIALHKSAKSQADRGNVTAKIVFGLKDVSAAREEIEAKGCKMGKINQFDGMELCDGQDPEGNRFQLSSRGM